MVTKKTVIAAVAACSVSAVALAATSFSDVPSDHWAADAITWANDSAIMTGPGDMPGMFNPGGEVNRAQLAVVSQRLYTKIMADMESKMMDMEYEEPMMDEDTSSEEDMAEWMEDADGTWMTKDGNMVRFDSDGNLEYSVDGRNWGALEGGTWMAYDGYMYMFDGEGMLMMSMDGETWEEADMWPGADGMWYMMSEGKVMYMSAWSVNQPGIWMDMDGTSYRYTEAGLEMTTDGTEWSAVESWTAYDGNMYMFDEAGMLMMSMDGETWEEATSWSGADNMMYKMDSEGNLWEMQGFEMMEEETEA